MLASSTFLLSVYITESFSETYIVGYFRDNIQDVDIYFEEMSVEKISQSPAYDEESLFGNYTILYRSCVRGTNTSFRLK